MSDPAPARSNLALCHSRFGQPGCRFRPPLVSIGGGRRCPGIDLPLLCVITHSRSLVCHYPIPIIGDWVRIFIQRRSQQRVCDRSCVHCPDSSPGTAAVDPPPNHAGRDRKRVPQAGARLPREEQERGTFLVSRHADACTAVQNIRNSPAVGMAALPPLTPGGQAGGRSRTCLVSPTCLWDVSKKQNTELLLLEVRRFLDS